MEIKLVNGIKIYNMKFKVINDNTGEVIKSNLTIYEARKISRELNALEVDYFYITCNQKEEVKDNIRNGEVVTELVEREIQRFLSKLTNQYPNDANLGAAIRKYIKLPWN
jgi:GMP synthase PP-ATPase subunit